MSSYSLKTILKSHVSEQAYFPLRLPESGWVCSAESNRSAASFLRTSVYCTLSCGFFPAIFFAFLRYVGEYSIFLFIKNSLHGVFNSLKTNGRFFLRFQHSFFEGLASAFPVGKIGYNSNSFISGLFRAAGIDPPTLNTGGKFQVPGYSKPMPIR